MLKQFEGSNFFQTQYIRILCVTVKHYTMMIDEVCYFVPGRGVKYCDEYVCLFVCLSACIKLHIPETAQPNFKKFFVLIDCLHYVMSVLWVGAYGASFVFLSGSGQKFCVDCDKILLNDKDEVHIVICALEVKAAVYDCLLIWMF